MTDPQILFLVAVYAIIFILVNDSRIILYNKVHCD